MTELSSFFNIEDFTSNGIGNTGTNCTVRENVSQAEIQIQSSADMNKCNGKKTKSRQLAERIADIDFVIRKRTDLLQSVDEVKRMYEDEKKFRVTIEKKLANYEQENEKLKDEVEEEKYKNNQLQAVVDETKIPIDVKNLVKGFVDLAQYSSDLSRTHLKCLNKLKPYCEKNGISVNNSKSPKNKTNLQNKTIDATVHVLARKPDTCTRGTQFDGIACTKASCATMTSDLIEYKDVGVMFPERDPLPDAFEILHIMKSWNHRPISPLGDEVFAEVKETQTRDTGSCTNICDINKVVDYANLIPHIKSSDSRPPSRLMCTDVKNEMLTFKERLEEAFLYNDGVALPKFSSDIFVKLWPVFGHMMLRIMNICSGTSPEGMDEILNVLLRKVSETFRNFETDNLSKHIDFAVKEPFLATATTNMCAVNSGPFKPIAKKIPKECDKSTATLSVQKTRCQLQKTPPNKSMDPSDTTENKETAVSFLSSQEIFNVENGFTYGELDEGEKDLLAVANESERLTSPDSLSEYGSEVEDLSPKLNADKNISTENVEKAQCANNDGSFGSDSPNSLIIDESMRLTSDGEETANEVQFSHVENEIHTPPKTLVSPLLALNEETSKIVNKTKPTTAVIDLPIDTSANVDSSLELLKSRTRKRKAPTETMQGDCRLPCKRSARLEAKRLADQGLIESPIQIGKYTTRNGSFQLAHLDNKSLKTSYNNGESPNCDKLELVRQKLFANGNEKTTECPTKSSISSNNPAGISCKEREEYSETTVNASFYYDSPISPEPTNNCMHEANDVLTPEIPTELSHDFYFLNSRSLLDRFFKINAHEAIMMKNTTLYSRNITQENNTNDQMEHVLTEYINTSIGETQELYLKLSKISLDEEDYLRALVVVVEQLQEINTQTLERLLSVVHHLDNIYPSFINQLLARFDAKLFILDYKRKAKIDAALKWTRVYLATIRLQANMKTTEYKNPARIFIAKILYFFQLEEEGSRLIFEVLCQFPTVLPHREDQSYDHSDPLITVIKHLLMNCKYDMHDQTKCHRDMLSMLRFQYHFEPFKPMQQDVIKQLVDKLECGKQEWLQLSFAILCKRMPTEKIMDEVLHGRLLPLANSFYDRALQSPSYDEHIEILLTCISTILKALPLETDTSKFMSVFTRFLNSIERQRIQEAAAQAILRLQRFGFEASGNALQQFRPAYTPQNLTTLMLRTYVRRKAKFARAKKYKT